MIRFNLAVMTISLVAFLQVANSQPISISPEKKLELKTVKDCQRALESDDRSTNLQVLRIINQQALNVANNKDSICRGSTLIKPLLRIIELEDKDAIVRVRNQTVIGFANIDLKQIALSALWTIGSAEEYQNEVMPVVVNWLSSNSLTKQKAACRILLSRHHSWLARDSQSVVREEPKFPPQVLTLLLKFFEDSDFDLQLTAVEASGIFGEEAIEPLFDKLRRLGPWSGKHPQFSYEQSRLVQAISRAFTIMADNLKCVSCAERALPQLEQYLDAKNPETILYYLVSATLSLSSVDPPHTTKLALPAFERLEKQRAKGLAVPRIAWGKANDLKKGIAMHESKK